MKIDELHIGQSYTLRRTFSCAEVQRFADLSLDTNPLHTDPDFAATSRFGRLIVPGFLSASLFSAIIGTRFPGVGSIYLSQDMRFLHPVFPDEEIVATVQVKELMPEKNRVLLETTCRDTAGTLLIDGQALVKLP
mgnify:CR=1 FL=1